MAELQEIFPLLHYFLSATSLDKLNILLRIYNQKEGKGYQLSKTKDKFTIYRFPLNAKQDLVLRGKMIIYLFLGYRPEKVLYPDHPAPLNAFVFLFNWGKFCLVYRFSYNALNGTAFSILTGRSGGLFMI